MITTLKELHSHWCKLTGQSPDEIKYAACERLLFNFHNNGYTKENMTAVLSFILHQNSKASHPKFRKPIRFHAILDEETFAGYLGEAGPWYRNRMPARTAKESVVAAFRGHDAPVNTHNTARPVRDVIAAIAKGINQQ